VARPGGGSSRLKLAVNRWLACLVEGLAETLALTAAPGSRCATR
jgi:hypothetical protein